MPTTFNVISLGVLPIIDSIEGNDDSENSSALVGLTFGSPTTPLADDQGDFSEFSQGTLVGGIYNNNVNLDGPESFIIDGGAPQQYDGLAVYSSTITYTDGTTAAVSAIIFQDVDGNTYWAPEASQNTDQTAMEAKPIASLTLNSVISVPSAGLFANRDAWELNNFPVCFTCGTLIKTRSGEVTVEDLRVGDEVLTMDAGYQPIRWIGGRKVSAAELQINPKLKPIRICADALGPGLPRQDLLVSPQHRVLVRSPIAARLFDSAEVLVPAKKLLDLPGIYVEDGDDGVEYFHILFDAHQLVWSNGAVTESLFTGPEALKAVSPEAREEITALFPEILEPDFAPIPARMILETGKEIRKLVERLDRHGKPVQAEATGLPSVS